MGIFGKKKTDEKATSKKAQEAKPKMKDLYGAQSKKAAGKKIDTKKGAAPLRAPQTAYRHLVRPLITEKAAEMATHNKYAFEVGIKSNKIEIAKAIEEVYGVKPTNVNIIRIDGKKVNYGRIQGKRKNWKKAIITLPKGKSINIYEGV